jgi:hypothetical protein
MMGPLLRILTLVAGIVDRMVTQASERLALLQWQQRGSGRRFARTLQRIGISLAAAVLFLPAQESASGNAVTTDSVLPALRKQVQQFVEQSPRYSCQLEIHRVQDKVSAGQKMEERAVLEVSHVDGKEHYSWPGDSPFREDGLRDLLVMGLSGTGSFTEHLRAVVLGEHTTFGTASSGSEGGHPVIRIPYRVPAGKSGYLVNLDGQENEAGIQGVITVIPPQMTVANFSLDATDLPAGFPATAVSEAIRYQVDSGVMGAFFPSSATQRMVEMGKDVYTNEITYRACKQFQGNSEIRFDAPSSSAGRNSEVAEGGALPEGVPIEFRLTKDIRWGSVRAGDPVEAELTRQIKWKGEVLVKERARVVGRVVEFKKLSGSANGYVVGLSFRLIEDKGKSMQVKASLEALTDMPKSNRRGIAAAIRGENAPYERLERIRPDGAPYPGAGFICVAAEAEGLPAGLAMRWATDDSRANY